MTQILIDPYVGPNYWKSDVRVALLGESHYGMPQPGDAERNVVKAKVWQWIRHEREMRYFALAACTLAGKKKKDIDRAKIFNDVLFFNIIQRILFDNTEKIHAREIRDSSAAFFEFLDTYDPTHIIVGGKGKLWNCLPKSYQDYSPKKFDDNQNDVKLYKTKSKMCKALRVPHFSWISPKKWHLPIKDFISE